MAEARAQTAEARTASGEARAALEGLQARRRSPRARALPPSPTKRRAGTRAGAAAANQIAELTRRQEELTGELAGAEARAGSRSPTSATRLLDAIATAEAARNEAADARAAGREPCWPKPTSRPRPPNAHLSAAREERARAQALSEAAASRIEELRTRIRDELECAPDELAERAEIKDGEELPPLEQAEKRVETLKQEREQLGGVNLRAEEEAAEQEARLTTLVADRDDLTGAIERLRRGIQSLNREGRERLLESFEKVNTNFQELVHQAVRRRRSQAHLHRIRRSAGSGAGNLRPPAGQAAAVAGAAVGRRTGADRHGADLRRVPGQSRARSACWTKWTRRWTTPMSSVSATCWTR